MGTEDTTDSYLPPTNNRSPPKPTSKPGHQYQSEDSHPRIHLVRSRGSHYVRSEAKQGGRGSSGVPLRQHEQGESGRTLKYNNPEISHGKAGAAQDPSCRYLDARFVMLLCRRMSQVMCVGIGS
ncbi:hypothetical protein E2P81_ATG11657 [Venturia nashicola]|nr:hypothetical protein E2P81_ATG11657 [Venturia nashicola]